MDNFSQNILLPEELLGQLKKFFSKNEIEEFQSKLTNLASEENSIITSMDNVELKDLEIDANLTEKFRMLVDRIITFAEKRLKKTRYLEFLVEVGKLSIIKGELKLASEIFNQILTNTNEESSLENIRANALLSLGDISCRQASWKEAINYIKSSKSIFEKQKDPKGLGLCEHLFGTIYLERGELTAANIRFENCLSYLNHDEDKLTIAMVEINLGIIKYIESDLDKAYDYYKSGLVKLEDLGDKRRVAEVRNNIGMVLLQKKKYDAALKEFSMCIEISVGPRYLQTLSLAYLNKALTYIELGDLNSATHYANKAMTISYQLNDKLSIAEIYKIKGIIFRELNNYDLSEDYLLTSLRLNRDLNNELNFAETSFELGLLHKSVKNKDESKQYLNNALNYYKKINSKSEIDKIGAYLS